MKKNKYRIEKHSAIEYHDGKVKIETYYFPKVFRKKTSWPDDNSKKEWCYINHRGDSYDSFHYINCSSGNYFLFKTIEEAEEVIMLHRVKHHKGKQTVVEIFDIKLK